MKTTILLVGHGSRNSGGNGEIERFTQLWQDQHADWNIQLCFIEFADILLDDGLSKAAATASRVIVVPLILNAAAHVKMEIPAHIAKARQKHPEVEFIFARHLGATDAILSILKRNLKKTLAELDVPDPKTTGVILLGRGSSDRVANGEVAKMARWLFEESEHELVDIAFTGITYPRLESAVNRQVQLGMKQVVILPYYLFTGTLIERIKQQVGHLKQSHPQVRFGLSHYFGFEPEIFALLNQRVQQADTNESSEQAMMECDGCGYRDEAQDQGHHHHHDHEHHHDH